MALRHFSGTASTCFSFVRVSSSSTCALRASVNASCRTLKRRLWRTSSIGSSLLALQSMKMLESMFTSFLLRIHSWLSSPANRDGVNTWNFFVFSALQRFASDMVPVCPPALCREV